jgi:hypothetical protein
MPSPESGQKDSPPSDIDLPCMPPDRPIVERLDEPLLEKVEYCMLDDSPCILFVDWDYAEDWSGTFVRVIRPHMLSTARRVGASEFWVAVRCAQMRSR